MEVRERWSVGVRDGGIVGVREYGIEDGGLDVLPSSIW